MTKPTTLSLPPARLEQIRTFLASSGYDGAELFPLAGDASFRRYVRIEHNGKSYMLMDAPPEKENVAPYIAIAEYLYRQEYSVPNIIARDTAVGFLLLEDLGDRSYTSLLRTTAPADKDAVEHELYAAAIDVLAAWHNRAKPIAHPTSLQLPEYDRALLLREVELFANWFLPQIMGKDMASSLRGEYMGLWEDIFSAVPLSVDYWVHRDYHADNLMWLPTRDGHKRVGILDFQDGVYGEAAYDMVSLLEDARRDVPRELVDAMLERYIAAADVNREEFMTAYAVLGAQRNSKIIGIFSRLAARDNKFVYLNYLPRVWQHLEYDCTHPALSRLRHWLDKHIPADRRGVIAVRHTSQELALTA